MSTVLEQLNSVPTVMLEAATPRAAITKCILLGIGYNEIHLRAEHRVAPASRVKIRFEHIAIAGEVLYCKPRDGAWFAGIGFASNRVDPRFPVNLPASIVELHESGSVRSDGTVTDICGSGLGLIVAQDMAPGCMICVETGFILAIGSVRFCHRQGNRGLFKVEMEIGDILHGAEHLSGFSRRLGSVRKRLAEAILGRQLQSRFVA
jgi:hypothetical protein